MTQHYAPTQRFSRSGRVIALVALIVVGAAALVIGLQIGGGAAKLPLADPGALVRWGLPFMQLGVNLAASLTIGGLLVALMVPPQEIARRRAIHIATGAAATWTVATICVAILTYISLDPTSWGAADFGARLALFFRSIELGQQLLWVIGLAAVLTIWCAAVRSTKLLGVGLVTAILTLLPLAFTGHSAANANHSAAVSALLVHIIAAAVWIGGLLVMASVGRSLPRPALTNLIKRYSTIAFAALIGVGLSGVLSVLVQTDLRQIVHSAYGAIVLMKIMLLIAMAWCGVMYRRRLIPQIAGAETTRPFWRLVAFELGCMVAVSGLAVALSRTPTPGLETVPGSTPAEILTGQPLPPPLTMRTLLTQWSIDPIWLVICGFGIGWYWVSYSRLRNRGDKWSIWRNISWTAGLVILAWMTNGALNRYQEYLFSIHMLGHMMLSMFVPVLLVAGAPVTLLMRSTAARKDGTWGPREWVLWLVHSPWGRFWANPIVASANFAISLVLFYYTPLFAWSVYDHLGHEWMLVHFLLVGYLFVQGLVGIDPGPKPSTYPFRLILLMGTMAFHAFFGISIMMGSGLLVPDWFGAMGRMWGAPPLQDQQNGGGIAWGIGELPTIALAVVVAIAWARSDERLQRRLDRQAERSHYEELNAYNDMLQRMAKHDDR